MCVTFFQTSPNEHLNEIWFSTLQPGRFYCSNYCLLAEHSGMNLGNQQKVAIKIKDNKGAKRHNKDIFYLNPRSELKTTPAAILSFDLWKVLKTEWICIYRTLQTILTFCYKSYGSFIWCTDEYLSIKLISQILPILIEASYRIYKINPVATLEAQFSMYNSVCH